LDKLFSEADTLRYIMSPTPTLLSQDQLLNAQTVGYVQYKLYFSYSLLSDEKRALVRFLSPSCSYYSRYSLDAMRVRLSIVISRGGSWRTNGRSCFNEPRRSLFGITCLWMSYRWFRRSWTTLWLCVGLILRRVLFFLCCVFWSVIVHLCFRLLLCP
jgi:hypothetical protein